MALFTMSGVLRGFAPAEYTFEARGKGPEAKGKFVFPIAYHLWPIAYDRPCSSEKGPFMNWKLTRRPTLLTLFVNGHKLYSSPYSLRFSESPPTV